MEKRIYEIPESVRIRNKIIFNHEDNEYVVTNGLYMAIPLDGIITKSSISDITNINFDFMSITLFVHADPQITIYNFKSRD